MAFSRMRTPNTFLEVLVFYLALFSILIEPLRRVEAASFGKEESAQPLADDSASLQFALSAAAVVTPIETFSLQMVRLDPEKFTEANQRFTSYLTPASRLDASDGNCEVWSSLLILVRDDDFLKFVEGFDKPSPKQLGFINFLGRIGGARHYKLDPAMDFDRPAKRGISLKTRQGKILTARTPRELGEKMLTEIGVHEKIIFLGTFPTLKPYVEQLPAGIYAIEMEYAERPGGHQVTLSISASRSYDVFDTTKRGMFPFHAFWKVYSEYRPGDLINVISYSPQLAAHSIDMQRLPSRMDLLSAFYMKDYRSCKEMLAHHPALASSPFQLYTTAIFYRGSLEDIKFLHEELRIPLTLREGYKTAPPSLTLSGSSKFPPEAFEAIVPLQYILLSLFQHPEKTPILDYLLEHEVDLNMSFLSSAGIQHTPLSMAIRAGLTEAALKLIANGADLSRKHGVDLIERALQVLNFDVLKALIRAGIDLQQRVNVHFSSSKQAPDLQPPIYFFNQAVWVLKDNQPDVASQFQELVSLSRQVDRESASHPRSETPIRRVMDEADAVAQGLDERDASV